MSVVLKKYIKKLTILYILSKASIKPKEPNIENFLMQFDNSFISRQPLQKYALVRRARAMIIVKAEIISRKQDNIYRLMLVEAFFTSSKKAKEQNKTSAKTQPTIIYVEIESSKTFQPHELMLIRIKGNYKPYCRISKKDYRKVMHLKLQHKHGLHTIIQKNLDYAKIYDETNNKTKNKKTSKTEVNENNIRTQYICVIVKNKDDLVVAKMLHNNAFIKLKDKQKSLKTLPDFTLILVDKDYRITKVLGSLLQGYNDKTISLNVANYNPASFSKEVLREARNMAQSLADIQGIPFPPINIKKPLDTTLRYDMTHLPFCTIDPINAKDHDDAIYYDSKMGVLYVAIADVSSYVTFNSAIDKAAQNNAFSLYFPNQVFPMLPPSLSSNACSLKPKKKRLALVWVLRLHKRTAAILHAQVYQAVICSHASLNYNQVTKFLENPSHNTSIKRNKEMCNSLIEFSQLAYLLHKKRMKQGIDLILQDFNIEIDNDENIKNISLQTRDKSHILVEEAMLLANQASANYLETIGYGIYRNHSYPQKAHFNRLMALLSKMDFNATPLSYKTRYKNKEIMQKTERKKMLDSLQEIQKEAIKKHKRNIIDFYIVRHFAKANYMIQNEGHFGLGFPCYTHFTSPIRRYSDLIVHRIITAYLQNNHDMLPAIIYKAKCVLPHINDREIQFDSIESYYKRLKMLRYAQSMLPFLDEALILEVRGGVAHGIPLNKIGFCNVVIRNIDSIVSCPMIAQIEIVGVDFNSMNLKATLTTNQSDKKGI